MPNDLAAVCESVVKTYRQATGEVRALKGIDASIPSGALTAIVGPSGSGKSSLLRLLGAIDRPTSGTVRVGDVRIDAASSRELRQLRRGTVGYVFQRPSDNFVSYMKVSEHMAMAVKHAAGRVADAGDLLRELGIAHRADHTPSELSGGEQQRAAIAQILVAGPRLIVADEPTAELDSASAAAVLEVIRALVDHGVTFVLATHDANVTSIADHLIELDHGLLKGSGHGEHGMPEVVDHRSRFEDLRATGPYGRRERAASTVAPDVVSIRDLTKTYVRGTEQVHALDDVDLTLRSGELVGLVGRSGSGKTTLLNMVAGWERPDSGSIDWSIEDIDRDLPAWRHVAVVPQKLGLMEELSARENIEYPARLLGTVDERADLVEDLIEELGLTELQDRLPRETSVGEQQRTALARALVLSPKLLLADEPSGHQDARWAKAVFAALERAAARGTCCLIATHNQEVTTYLDRVERMADGRIVEAADATAGGRA